MCIPRSALREKCPHSDLYSFEMRENTDQNNSKYEHFSRIDVAHKITNINIFKSYKEITYVNIKK